MAKTVKSNPLKFFNDNKAKRMQTGGQTRPQNMERTKGTDPLSEYSPKLHKGSGNLIPVGVKTYSGTNVPLNKPKSDSTSTTKTTPKKKSGGSTKSKNR